MSKSILWLIVISACAIGCSDDPGKPETEEDPPAQLEITSEVTPTTLTVGESVSIRLLVTNPTQEELSVWLGSSCEYGFQVLDDDDNRIIPIQQIYCSALPKRITYEPGEVVERSWGFSPWEPGTYTVMCGHGAYGEAASAPSVQVTVLPRES